ncbi:hypothetical protein [Dactylosporangium sp. CA-139066]|uniref:hypothetical protein n=1 Tax=Dactylosporangium sp. CA-139066 TaxID=3239930 RepID=UPI003D8C0C56
MTSTPAPTLPPAPAPPAFTAVKVGRWRVPAGTRITGVPTETPHGHAAEFDLIELDARVVTGASFAVTIVAPGGTSARQVVVDRAEALRVMRLGHEEPDVLTKHITEVFYARYAGQLFGTEISPRDVRQGSPGDCRTMSSLQAIADVRGGPDFLRSKITPVAGGYLVSLLDVPAPGTAQGGRRITQRQVFVSDYFPTAIAGDATDRVARYASSGRRPGPAVTFPLWPAVLEKALATLWGGYGKLEHFDIHEDLVFRALGIYAKQGHTLSLTNSGPGGQRPTAATVEQFVRAAAGRGAAITAPGMSSQHNFAVLDVRPGGVTLADPRTAQGSGDLARWDNPKNGSDAEESELADYAYWPMRFTWQDLMKRVRWFCTYDIPELEKDSDGKEGKGGKDGR